MPAFSTSAPEVPALRIMMTLRRALLPLILAALFVAGCDCGPEIGGVAACNAPECCLLDEDCNAGVESKERWSQFCSVDPNTPNAPREDSPRGVCEDLLRECNIEGECCPGQTCAQLAGEGICSDRFTACEQDSGCTVEGQVCRNIGLSPSGNGCTFEPCGSGGSCADGLSCFNGYCVGEPPCNGGCPVVGGVPSVCTPVNNRCFQLGEANDLDSESKEGGCNEDGRCTPGFQPSSCFQSCREGTLLTFVDGHNVWNQCLRTTAALACRCEPLPPVSSNDMSRHSDIAVADEFVFVSAYDGVHGDLVLHTFPRSDLNRRSTTWIDGIPESGAVIGNPDGPRGGRADPGADVGQHTSIAFDPAAQRLHIAYHAIHDGTAPLRDLRYAGRTGDGDFRIHTLDGRAGNGDDTGDVGHYTSLALSPEGHPVIAYFQKSGFEGDEARTALKVARAKVREPQSANDWHISVVATGERMPPPCLNSCGSGEVCTEDVENPYGVCRKRLTAANCDSSCRSSQECTESEGAEPACRSLVEPPAIQALPEGNGLHPSITYLDGTPVVVWYDQNNGQLMGAVASSDSAATGAEFRAENIQVLDSGAYGGQNHDVGRFPSVAVGPSSHDKRIAVTYLDATTNQLRLLLSTPDWSSSEKFLVDEGVGDGYGDTTLFVGADSAVSYEANRITAVYQDATGNALRIADMNLAYSTTFTVQSIQSDGGGGFYAAMAGSGQNRYVSHAVLKARSSSEPAHRLEVIHLP